MDGTASILHKLLDPPQSFRPKIGHTYLPKLYVNIA